MTRWTIQELKGSSNDFILRQLVGERLNKLSNPYSPLSQRLQKIHDMLSRKIEKEK